MQIRQYELVVTNRKIAARTGLISKTVQDCPLDKIDTVVVQNDLIGTVCGCGTVVVKAVNGTFRYNHIVNAAQFKNDVGQRHHRRPRGTGHAPGAEAGRRSPGGVRLVQG